MFSGALLDCLKNGVPNGPAALTLEDVDNRVRDIIKIKFPNDAVRPELHVPDQPEGNPAKVELFPNSSWVPIRREGLPPLENSAEPKLEGEASSADLGTKVRKHFDSVAFAKMGVTTPLSSKKKALVIVIGICTGILSWLSIGFLPRPLGLHGASFSEVFAPLGPAICLSVSLLVLNQFPSKMGAAFFGLATLLAWQVAWSFVCFRSNPRGG
jgi:hypothetical protein